MTSYKLDYPKGIGEAKWKLSYPRAFPALVAKNTKANQLPEALQLAIMREESAFSPRIESFANAIGLTQMLVKTAKRFANGANVTREVLQDPAKNLEIGSRFLGFLWKHRGPRVAERARRLLLVSLRLRGLVFRGERGRAYRDGAAWLASGDAASLVRR